MFDNDRNSEILTIVANLLDGGYGIQTIQKSIGFTYFTTNYIINEVKRSRRNNKTTKEEKNQQEEIDD